MNAILFFFLLNFFTMHSNLISGENQSEDQSETTEDQKSEELSLEDDPYKYVSSQLYELRKTVTQTNQVVGNMFYLFNLVNVRNLKEKDKKVENLPITMDMDGIENDHTPTLPENLLLLYKNLDNKIDSLAATMASYYKRQGEQFELLKIYIRNEVVERIKNLELDVERIRNDHQMVKGKGGNKSLKPSRSKSNEMQKKTEKSEKPTSSRQEIFTPNLNKKTSSNELKLTKIPNLSIIEKRNRRKSSSKNKEDQEEEKKN